MVELERRKSTVTLNPQQWRLRAGGLFRLIDRQSADALAFRPLQIETDRRFADVALWVLGSRHCIEFSQL